MTEKPDGTKSVEIEELFADIDTKAIEAMRNIDKANALPPRNSKDREILAAFIALQTTPTPEQRERVLFPLRVSQYAAGREITQPLVTEYLEKVHLGFQTQRQRSSSGIRGRGVRNAHEPGAPDQ